MKKFFLFGIAFIYISVLVFNLLFTQENYAHYRIMLNINSIDSNKVVISYGDKKTTEVYQIIKKYLDTYNGNMYCNIITNDGDVTRYIKYVYFTNDTIFNNIDLHSGRFLDVSENESVKYLSTENTKDINQIGRVLDFSGDHHFEIRTLNSNLITNLFDRNFYIQLSYQELDMFIYDLKDEGIHIEKVSNVINDKYTHPSMYIIAAICFFVLVLLMLYHIFNSYKVIAIEKMLGFNAIYIWLKRVFPIIILAVICMFGATGILTIVKFKEYNIYLINFINTLLKYYEIVIVFIALFISIPFVYVKKISISNMLKNRKPVDEIIGTNNLIKWVLTVVFLVLSVNQFNLYKQSTFSYNNAFSQWEKTKEYAVIPEIAYPPGAVNTIKLFSEESFIIEKELFMYFNKKGAVYANFKHYIPEIREENTARLKDFYKTDIITINPNYLKNHEVYNIQGEKVEILESETKYILLVPEKYEQYEKEIREYTQFIKNGYASHAHDSTQEHIKFLDDDIPDIVDEEIKIIWIKSEQNFFSYRLDINPNNNNCVKDPIARVLTESNGDLRDYYVILGLTGDPFKIKIDNISSPSANILPKLREYYDSDNYIFPVVNVYDSIQDEIVKANEQIKYTAIIIVALLIIISTIIVQNIINYFEQHKKRLVMQHFHGFKKIDKYKNYIFTTTISWLLILIISFLFTKNIMTFFLGTFLFILELSISVCLLSYNESKKIINLIRGG